MKHLRTERRATRVPRASWLGRAVWRDPCTSGRDDGRPSMSMKIVEADCINCAACEPECPNTAISNTGTTFVVDAALCTECVGAHDTPSCVDVCPTSCILVDPAEPREVLLERYQRLHA